jgi:hypothetical protein
LNIFVPLCEISSSTVDRPSATRAAPRIEADASFWTAVLTASVILQSLIHLIDGILGGLLRRFLAEQNQIAVVGHRLEELLG